MLLDERRLLITGVMTRQSLAYAVAEEAQREGAEVLLSSFGRVRRLTERAARHLPRPPDVLELDVNRGEDFDALVEVVRKRWGGLDGALHSIAHGPPDALGGNFLNTPPESAAETFLTSAYSLKELVRALRPLFHSAGGGAVAGFTFDASRAWPAYDWMGVAKASLESACRYLASYLGAEGIRVNLLAPGPLRTPSASALPAFESFARYSQHAPLGWDLGNPRPAARAACFLLSDWSEGISGQVLHVDGGFRAMGRPFEGMDEVVRALDASRGDG